jgi:hypothetical protein
MMQVAAVIQRWLGWCPNTHVLKVQAPVKSTGTGQTSTTDRQSPWPGILPRSMSVVPHWMTVLGLGILFATFFVGGNFWWPVLVSIVLVFCIAVLFHRHYRQVP